jgi:secondary thiamine-phosphate synthase enzyme
MTARGEGLGFGHDPLQRAAGAAKRSVSMFWHQAVIRLQSRPRGFHLITGELLGALPELGRVRVGILHLFLQHTSASLAINENADPDVRADLERWARRAVPDGASYFEHTTEGSDDMPAHVKSALFGPSLSIPIREGRLLLGTWQGVYLGEHRDHGGGRTVVATLWGDEAGSGGTER